VAAAAGDVAVANEDRKRAGDRVRVQTARLHGKSPLLLWLLIGPGILTIIGENDGPSMISYAQTGAQFGIGFFLPFIAALFVMAYIVQEMTVRLGAATHRGHAAMIFDRFGPFWGWFSLGDLALGNFLTLITEFIASAPGWATSACRRRWPCSARCCSSWRPRRAGATGPGSAWRSDWPS